jgi:tetratricopeptide (TPR) repeat protein
VIHDIPFRKRTLRSARASCAAVAKPVALFAAFAVLAASPAHAQKAVAVDTAAAEALFTQGRSLMADKKFDAACAKFAASQRLDPAPGTLLNLAGCYEAAGKTASAWAAYREAESAASRSQRTDWERTARERAEALAPRLSMLTVIVPAASRPPGLAVERGGQPVAPEVFGEPVPVDPGLITLSASAPGMRPWSMRVDVAAEAGRAVVTVPAFEEENALAPNAPAGVAPDEPREGSGSRTSWTVLALGVGGAGLAAGTIFGLLAKSTYDTAIDADCRGRTTTCNAAGVDHVSDARTQAALSTAFFVGGALAVATGAVLWAATPARASRASVVVAPSAAGAAIYARGTF